MLILPISRLIPVFRYFGSHFPSLYYLIIIYIRTHVVALGETHEETPQDDQLGSSQQPIFERTRIVEVCQGNRLENVRGNASGKVGYTDKQKYGVTHSESSG